MFHTPKQYRIVIHLILKLTLNKLDLFDLKILQ